MIIIIKERVIIYDVDIFEKVNNNFSKMTVEIIEEAMDLNFNRLDIYSEYFEIFGGDSLELDVQVIFSIPIITIYDKITDDGLEPILIGDLDILILPVTKNVRKRRLDYDEIWEINQFTTLARYGVIVEGKYLEKGHELFDKRFIYQIMYKDNVLAIRIRKL